MASRSKFSTKQLVFCAMALALATVISVVVKLPSLPNGGSVTLFSMLILCACFLTPVLSGSSSEG